MSAPPPPPEVNVVEARPKTVPVSYEFVGQTAGSREVEVRARVTGILLKRNYEEGSLVRRGQSLFTIDPEPFRAALARAQADLAAARAKQAQTQRDAQRLKPLYAAKAVSQKDYDDAVSAEQIASAEVQAAQARVTEARLNLEYTRVEAPITGIASRALKSEGSLVSGPDVLLTTVTQIDPLYVNFGISGTDQLKLKREVEVGRLTLPDEGKFDVGVVLADGTAYAHTGKLAFTDVRVNTSTGTSDARATLPNPDGMLQPGQFVRVRLEGATRRNAISLPQRAVLEGPKGKFVYVVNAQGKAEPRPVDVGDWTADSWLINTGVKPGELVIVDGVMKIGPGAPVRVATSQPETRTAPTKTAETGPPDPATRHE
ncbi:MAG TPA: efflux RND transporter periplasmic adaptor subunit [Burkholderiales bacterium]|nr:efflux RND transporter periplasmic adaptor subunit [Burkholderiales bacterium]